MSESESDDQMFFQIAKDFRIIMGQRDRAEVLLQKILSQIDNMAPSADCGSLLRTIRQWIAEALPFSRENWERERELATWGRIRHEETGR